MRTRTGRGVSLPKARGNFFTKENYPQSIDTDVPMIAFYIMDRHWYHRLLNASVEQGMKIEKELEEIYPNISLSTAIKEKSPTRFLFTKFKIHSGGKLDFFYFLLTFSFLIISWVIYKFNI